MRRSAFTPMGLKTWRHRYLAYAFVAFMQGCTSLSQHLLQNVPPDYQLSQGDQEGLIVVSTRFLPVGCPGASSISSAFFTIFTEESESKTASGIVWMKSPSLTPDPVDPARQLSVRKLKPGRYNFGQFSYAFTTMEKASTNDKVGLPFSVAAGQVHYLGEVVVTAEDCRTLGVKVNNQRHRDMDLLATRLSKIPPASVKNQILAVSETRAR
jgi:hypothetical protein